MGRKGGKYKTKEKSVLVKNNSVLLDSDDEVTMNDEIDAFHKSRDVVPLTVSDDMDDSDEDNEQPVFDFEDDDDDDEDDEDEDIDDEDKAPKGLVAKIVRQQKYLRSKFGGVEDALLDDADEEDQERFVWPRKSDLYGADVHDPQSSDDEDAAEEEREVLKMQSKRAEVLSMEDFGLKDASQDETDTEPTFEEILDHGKPTTKAFIDKEIKDEDGMTYEILHKDLNALTKEEQMDIVKSSSPELIGLLSQMNDALEQLDRVTPLVDKVISGDDDIPKRDYIGERRRKHELRVLAGAGIGSVDDVEDGATNISSDGTDANGENDVDSDLDYYEQVKREHAAKLAAKFDKYSRTVEVPFLPDTVIDGKRHITRQIEKNRGLTPSRKKQRKNPRTAYKMKHQKAQTRRKGQVRGIIRPTGPYGGEASGINPSISHSRRFAN